jgi:hypothetical protein
MLANWSSRGTRSSRLLAGAAIVLFLAAGWFCLAESHDDHDHGLPHDLCGGMVVVAVAILAAVVLLPAGALVPSPSVFPASRVVPVVAPPPRAARAQ